MLKNITRCLLALAVLGPGSTFAAPSTPINEARFVPLGGIQQWITIHGTNRRNLVVLILHGGPGDAQSPFESVYSPLEREFVVVQWDQRGAGRTLAAGGPSQPTSLDQLTRDGIELAEYLRTYLRTKNIILLGHSWGSFLGVHIVERRPDLFRAFVGTGQVVSWRGMVEEQYRYTLARARADSNAPAAAALETLGVPDPKNFDQYLGMRRWLNQYLAPSDVRWITGQDALVRAALSSDEANAYWRGFQTMSGLSSTVFSMDLPSLGFSVKLPFFLIEGSDDHIAPASMAAGYFDAIKAPIKRLTRIDGAGHFALTTHTAQFASALREDVRLLKR